MRLVALALLVVVLLPVPAVVIASPDASPAQQSPRCRFFTETAGGQGGFNVCDDAQARFLTAFETWGLLRIGYPISKRYVRDGFVTQAYQKAIMQARPDMGGATVLVNIFDDLHDAGFDPRLLETRQTPLQVPGDPPGTPFAQVVATRQAWLNTRPALRQAYFSVGDPLTFFGLPTSQVQDMGNHYAIRLQRSVLQEWKENVPWARIGEVTIANGGDIAKELGGLPAEALAPEAGTTPPPAAATHDWRAPGYVAAVGGQLYDPDCQPLRSAGINAPNLLYRTGQDETLEWMRQHGLRWVRVFATGHSLGPERAPRDAASAAAALRAFLTKVEAFNARVPRDQAIYVLVSLTDYYPPGVPGDRHAFDHPTFRETPVLPAPWFRAGLRQFDFDQEHNLGVVRDLPNYEVNYKPWVQQIVPSVANSRALLGWQLGNELKARGSPRNGISSAQAYEWYLAFTRDVVDTIRSLDRQHLIVMGAQYIAELVDWEYRPEGAPLPDRVAEYRNLVGRMLAACGANCWNVWGLTIYDFNPYPLDDARLFAEAGVASIATEHGFTRGTPEEMARRFGGDRAAAVRTGIDRPWQDLNGQIQARHWGARELVERAPLAAIASWGSPAPGLGSEFDTDATRGITGTPDEAPLWAAWTDVATGLEAANRAAAPSQACLARSS